MTGVQQVGRISPSSLTLLRYSLSAGCLSASDGVKAVSARAPLRTPEAVVNPLPGCRPSASRRLVCARKDQSVVVRAIAPPARIPRYRSSSARPLGAPCCVDLYCLSWAHPATAMSVRAFLISATSSAIDHWPRTRYLRLLATAVRRGAANFDKRW